MITKEKLNDVFQATGFYLSNFFILMFFVNIFNEKSFEQLLTLCLSLLAIIGAFSALCYTSSTSQPKEPVSKILRISGDRFLHSFMSFTLASIFSGAILQVLKNGVWWVSNQFVVKSIAVVFVVFSTIYFLKAARSFSIGFHMALKVLDAKFKLKDEVLFDNIEKE